MYTVYLADDEQLIREGLADTIPWQSLGLRLTETAADGKQALRGIRRVKPDIVLTDIRMPYLNGLELIAKIREAYAECRIVIITGHGEFSYAQKAIQLGVSDFALKPIDIPALCRTLTKIVKELDNVNSRKNEVEELRVRLQRADEYQLRQHLLRYVTGRITRQKFVEALPEEMRKVQAVGLVLLQIDNFDHLTSGMDEETIFSMTQRIELSLNQVGENARMTPIEESGGRYILLFLGNQAEELRFEIRSFIRRLRLIEANTEFTTVSSRVYASVEDCFEAYRTLQEGCHYAFQMGTNRDIHVEDLQKNTADALAEVPNVSRVLRSISTFNKKHIRKDFELLAADIRQTGHNSYLYTRMLVSVVYSEIGKLLLQIGYPIESVMKDPLTEYRKILTCTTLDDMLQELYGFVAQICDFIEKNSSDGKSAAERAKVYIEAHYDDSSLTLDRVASEVGISPNYFSALFKQCTNSSFINYLTSVRIGHAKELLKSGKYKTYEVAARCGYENPTYFSTIFKRQTGLSPTEYRGE